MSQTVVSWFMFCSCHKELRQQHRGESAVKTGQIMFLSQIIYLTEGSKRTSEMEEKKRGKILTTPPIFHPL